MSNPSEEQNGTTGTKKPAAAEEADTFMNGDHSRPIDDGADQLPTPPTEASMGFSDNSCPTMNVDNSSESVEDNHKESLKPPVAVSKGESEATLMNGGTAAAPSTSSLELTQNDATGEKLEMDIDAEDFDVPDEEENLFILIEKEKEKEIEEEMAHPHSQPKTLDAAPRLLQAALKEGQVKNSDSEEESDKERATSPEKKEEILPHYHKRESHLDFLLSKASEYSNFISQDLDELQAAMAENARKAISKAEKKKRKAEGKGSNNKMQKTSEGAQKLETAQTKDAVQRKTSKPIFVQPPNLAAGCFLKDYQLEGVRWLASLFENGVSGILADGT